MSREAQRRWLAGLLAADLGLEAGASPSEALTPFQQTAVVAVERALEVFGGALLADEVGLGKTHVALEVAARRGGGLLVCAPAALQGMWRRALARAGLDATLLTHALLARRASQGERFGLVIVDEAHAFANPATARARALSALGTTSPLLLLTATPVGLSPAELGALLRLFVRPGALLAALGESLEAHLARPEAALDLSALSRTVLVRRPRRLIQRAWPGGVVVREGDGGLRTLAFPQRDQRRLVWSLRGLDATLERLLEGIERLDEGLVGMHPGLLRALLLARLESSPQALDASLGRLEGFLQRRREAASAGRGLDRAAWRRCFGGLGAEEDRQQVLSFVFDAPLQGHQAQVEALTRQVALVQWLRASLAPWLARDPKLEALAGFLEAEVLPGGRALIFTRFADTAHALLDGLSRRLPGVGAGMVCGQGAWLGGRDARGRPLRVAPEEALARFEAPVDGEGGAVRLLVATDVLSEGLDLHRCDCVISHDLPWNPRTLVQRHGRIDRLGAPGRRITTAALLPGAGLERWLGLVERVCQRASRMDAALGEGAGLGAWLGGETGGWLRRALAPEGLEPEALAPEAEPWGAVELQMRLELLRHGQSGLDAPRGGWRLRAAPRQPPGVVMVFSLGVPGALPWWCFVPEEVDGAWAEGRAALYPRVASLSRRLAEPLTSPPARALRLGLERAWAQRQRVREATLRPWPHPPHSTAAKLLRRLAACPPVPSHDLDGLARLSELRRRLMRPLPAHLAARAEALMMGDASVEALAEALGEDGGDVRLQDKGLELLGFVMFFDGGGRPAREGAG